MSDPTFSLIYTSVRPDYIPAVVKLWGERSATKDVEFIICVDQGDTKSLAAANAARASSPIPVDIVINTGPKTCVSGWNTAATKALGRVLIAVADDFTPPKEWDKRLLTLEPRGWIDGEHVVHTEDGYVHNIMVLGIITRKRYEKFGYFFYPKYQSLFCDTELTETAYRDGVVIDAHHLYFEHCHPDCSKRQRDQADLIHASQERWNSGEMIFNFRKSRGFPIDDGPKAVRAESKTKPASIKFAVYLQVTKDDLCLFEVCKRMLEEGCEDFFFAVPDEYWSGEPTTFEDKESLRPVFAELTAIGAKVNIQEFHVPSYRISKEDSRIIVETRVRNDSLAWIRKSGFEHILIVDGDELWLPGTLAMVRPYVEQGHAAVSVRMIPVIGTPGYPIEAASDVAVVYISPKCDFKVCRSPTAHQTIIEQRCIIHFTSTRRTSEENIAKHRRSGHYDDPDYAFEDWISKTLPNAKPGLIGAHMYRKHQIWPAIRHWRPEELAVIPASVHPFLGK